MKQTFYQVCLTWKNILDKKVTPTDMTFGHVQIGHPLASVTGSRWHGGSQSSRELQLDVTTGTWIFLLVLVIVLIVFVLLFSVVSKQRGQHSPGVIGVDFSQLLHIVAWHDIRPWSSFVSSQVQWLHGCGCHSSPTDFVIPLLSIQICGSFLSSPERRNDIGSKLSTHKNIIYLYLFFLSKFLICFIYNNNIFFNILFP